MRVTLGPIASSTGFTRSKAVSSPPIMIEALPAFTVTGEPESGPSSMIAPAFKNSSAMARLSSGSIVLMSMKMAFLAMPDTMPSGPSATLRTALASVTIENTISDCSATARGVAAHCMPALSNASAFSRDLFQPVT